MVYSLQCDMKHHCIPLLAPPSLTELNRDGWANGKEDTVGTWMPGDWDGLARFRVMRMLSSSIIRVRSKESRWIED